MNEIFEEIAVANEWVYEYARKDFQNLYDSEEIEKIHIFVDPIKIDENFDEYGNVYSTDFSGTFMLVKSSDIDENYEEHYKKYIAPIIKDSTKAIKNHLKCDTEYIIKKWSTIEVINALDFNFSGVIVNYSITSND